MTAALIVIAVLALWLVFAFNKLVSLRNQVLNAFRQIDVQLKRRYDLIPNLVNSVKGEMKFEQETLEKVIKARNSAAAANAAGNIAQMGKSEGELSAVLTRFMALSENYPTLKANETVTKLMEELTSTENKIAFARQLYNDLVTSFNTAQQVFPNNLFAAAFGFKPADLFEIPENAAERVAPKVEL